MAKKRKRIIKTAESSGKSDKQLFLDTKFDTRPSSNFVGGKFIDRLYGSGNSMRLIQEDGSHYSESISIKKRKFKRMDGSTGWQTLYVTKDDRWFDNSGMPMQKPEIENNEVQNEEDSEND